MSTLATKIFLTLRRGGAQLTPPARAQIREFVHTQYQGGGFINRANAADLYYTLFGLAISAALCVKIPHRPSADFLALPTTDDLVHQVARDYARRLLWLLRLPPCWRGICARADFFLPRTTSPITPPAKTPYENFLQLLAHRGGTTNPAENWSLNGTNQIAAAVAWQCQHRQPPTAKLLDRLLSAQEKTGGFVAAPAAPMADLLSTATALFALRQSHLKPRYPARNFIYEHWNDDGGFCATLIDRQSDCEYTFYGLLAAGAI